MDIKSNIEQELIFQVESGKNKKTTQGKKKKIMRVANENLRRFTLDRIKKRTGDC